MFSALPKSRQLTTGEGQGKVVVMLKGKKPALPVGTRRYINYGFLESHVFFTRLAT